MKSNMYQIYAAQEADTDECILWDGALSNGYGQVRYKGKRSNASRVSLIEATGRDPEGLDAAHKPEVCHNPSCINPRHLRWSTRSENMQDMNLDGTSGKNARDYATGADHPRALLTEEDVIQIFNLAHEGQMKQIDIAEKFSTHQAEVSAIKLGKKWQSVTLPLLQGKAR
jgi:hypothetical protein